MTTLEYIDTYAIPAYALPYLINDDASGLTPADLEEIQIWLEQFPYDLLTYELISDETEFKSHPAFGLATDCLMVAVHGDKPQKFTEHFPATACEGDMIEVETCGFTISAMIISDMDYNIDDDDSHNPDQSVTGCDDKQYARLMAARRAWFNNEWYYCGLVLRVSKGGVVIDDHATSLWGLECNYGYGDSDNPNAYLTEIANDILDEAIEAGYRALHAIVRSHN